MKFVIQRVEEASVSVEKQIVGKINHGLFVLVGIQNSDTYETVSKMVQKLIGLRIFEDENGKTNLNLESVNGELLIVSQFTLYADCKKGNRPSFIGAGNPEYSNELYEYMLTCCREKIKKVAQGEFGAHMKISLINDGPFTVCLNSDDLGF